MTNAAQPASLSAHAPLMGVVWPASKTAGWVRTAVLLVAAAALLTLSAKVRVPFYPVPMTMQTFAVLVIGAAYGWRLGAAAVLLYLAQGAVGLPVFADTPERGLGIAYMMGPTGGYLVGFVASAAFVGWLAERGWDRSVAWLVVAMALGHALVFVFGAAWLAVHVGWAKAWALGVAPFYLATVLKTVLGAVTLPLAWTMLGRRAR